MKIRRALRVELLLTLTRLTLIALITSGVTACMGPTENRDKLAAEGRIQEDAPVKATVQTLIAAPPEKVWRVLMDIPSWPKWQPDISAVSIQGAPTAGQSFSWTLGGTSIQSTLRRVEPQRSICWTGRVWHIRAIHCWNLSAGPDGGTVVNMQESMDGWLISRLYPSDQLRDGNRRWLARLKQAAEAH
jgi:uncharacterized protein YndB with AHSA1/START domain